MIAEVATTTGEAQKSRKLEGVEAEIAQCEPRFGHEYGFLSSHIHEPVQL